MKRLGRENFGIPDFGVKEDKLIGARRDRLASQRKTKPIGFD
jgi:hypothetical protein